MRWTARFILPFCSILAMTTSVSAQIPSIGFAAKAGYHRVDEPRRGRTSWRPAWSLEIESPYFADEQLALIGSLDGTRLRSDRDAHQWTHDEVDYAESIKHSFAIDGGRVGVRWRVPRTTPLQLYLTAGVGYYQYMQSIRTQTTATWWNAEAEEYASDTNDSTRNRRRDRGFYPFASVGGEVPVGGWSSVLGQTHVLVEAEYEWDKRFRGADLGGLRLLAGLRWRF
jgi:hypothetical protein